MSVLHLSTDTFASIEDGLGQRLLRKAFGILFKVLHQGLIVEINLLASKHREVVALTGNLYFYCLIKAVEANSQMFLLIHTINYFFSDSHQLFQKECRPSQEAPKSLIFGQTLKQKHSKFLAGESSSSVNPFTRGQIPILGASIIPNSCKS